MKWVFVYEIIVLIITGAFLLLDLGLLLAILRARRKVTRRQDRRRVLYARWRPPLLEYLLGKSNAWILEPVNSHREAIDLAELIIKVMEEEGPFPPQRVAEVSRQSMVASFLLSDLSSADLWRKQRAAYLCGRLGLKEAITELRVLAEHKSADIALQAMESLCLLEDTKYYSRMLQNLLCNGRYSTYQISVILSYLGKAACNLITDIISVLKPEESAVREDVFFTIIDFMLEVHCPQLVGWTTSILKAGQADTKPRLLYRAIRAAGEYGLAGLIPSMENFRNHPAREIRKILATSLGMIKDTRAVALLAEMLYDDDWWVRLEAAKALTDMERSALTY